MTPTEARRLEFVALKASEGGPMRSCAILRDAGGVRASYAARSIGVARAFVAADEERGQLVRVDGAAGFLANGPVRPLDAIPGPLRRLVLELGESVRSGGIDLLDPKDLPASIPELQMLAGGCFARWCPQLWREERKPQEEGELAKGQMDLLSAA